MLHIKPFLLLENVAQAKALLKKLDISNTDENFVKINKMLSGNGYTYWFTKLLFVDKQPFSEIENIWNTIKNEPRIISKFTKPVVQLENAEKFWDEYLSAKGLANAKSMYNEFASLQKKFIDLKNEGDINLLNDLYKDKNKNDFIRKISSYHSRNELIDRLNSFLYKKTDTGFDKLINSLEKEDVQIVYQSNDNDIIVTVVDLMWGVVIAGTTAFVTKTIIDR
jgi:hypothetical protein